MQSAIETHCCGPAFLFENTWVSPNNSRSARIRIIMESSEERSGEEHSKAGRTFRGLCRSTVPLLGKQAMRSQKRTVQLLSQTYLLAYCSGAIRSSLVTTFWGENEVKISKPLCFRLVCSESITDRADNYRCITAQQAHEDGVGVASFSLACESTF